MKQLLEGLKVIDLSRYISGPYCGMLLADLGADVVKVEKLKYGDDSRQLPPYINGESAYYFVMNRNKRGASVDFRSSEGKELLFELASQADVLIENFRPGTIEKMGCGYEDIKKVNPKIIMASISGFGSSGPYSEKPGFDAAVQAMSGLMSLTGQEEGPPMMGGAFYVDYSAAMYTTISILAALYARRETGKGQYIEVSLLDSAVSLLLTAFQKELVLHEKVSRVGNRDRQVAPGNVFRTKDGEWIMVVAGSDQHFSRLVKVMGMDHLLKDERFSLCDVRKENAAEIEEIVQHWISEKNLDELVHLFDEAGIVCAKVESISDVVNNPQLKYRNKIIKVKHDKMGDIPMAELPMSFSDAPFKLRYAAPLLGQHNTEVLQEWLRRSPEEIQMLCEKGVID